MREGWEGAGAKSVNRQMVMEMLVLLRADCLLICICVGRGRSILSSAPA